MNTEVFKTLLLFAIIATYTRDLKILQLTYNVCGTQYEVTHADIQISKFWKTSLPSSLVR